MFIVPALQPLQLRLRDLQESLLAEKKFVSHWTGELAESALSTATAISAFSFYLEKTSTIEINGELNSRIEKCCRQGMNWLLEHQNQDGGWGDTVLNYSNISTSMLVMAAMHASGRIQEFGESADRLKPYIEASGGVEAIKTRYGKDKTFAVPILANCAMAGIVDWNEVDAFPFEAACVPQKYYRWLQLPVVSYAIPALVAIGQVKHKFDPPRNPLMKWIRDASIRRSLDVLKTMQPASGGYLEAIPLTSFVCMALIQCDLHDHPVVKNGIRFLLDSFRELENDRGSWPIDTNLATWVTTLSVNALAANANYKFEEESWAAVLDWVLSCQYKSIHPFTGAEPGGWGWSDLTGSVPDADDTPGALLALKNLESRMSLTGAKRQEIQQAAQSGVNWLLNLQNRDQGWPTFCRGWGRFPFDRSGSDLTAHAIRALIAWSPNLPKKLASRCDRAIQSGFAFLSNSQHNDGAWLPLWFGNQDQVDEINPFYGTAKVLFAYNEANRFDTKEARLGLEWLRNNQNTDGGWGGGPSIAVNAAGVEGWSSSIEETALCTEALLLDDELESRKAAEQGLIWLCRVIESGAASSVSPIGFYFAKLWYFEKLYPLIFATSALGVAEVRLAGRQVTEN